VTIEVADPIAGTYELVADVESNLNPRAPIESVVIDLPLTEEAAESRTMRPTIGTTGHPRIFGAYLFCDWSAANHPKAGPDSIWIADGWFERDETFEWGICENPRTRHAAEQIIRNQILLHRASGRRTLLGFDFPFGYPAAALASVVACPQPTWRHLWQLLEERIVDDEQNVNNRFSVAGAINSALNKRWYWGAPTATESLLSTKNERGDVSEFRLVEESLRANGRRPFSVWQLFGNGSVGSQTLVGLPTCERLRADDSLGLRVWPFETGLAIPPPCTTWNVLAEVWPGAVAIDESLHETKDAAQMLSLVRWAAQHDACGTFAPMFTVPSLAERNRELVENVEGWILGWTGNTATGDAS
jgi:peptidoglycan/xylan/chitin deacetylase (PgdA/CDA1 family)